MYSRFDLANLLRTEPTTRNRIGEPFPFRNEKRREITSQWVVGPGNTDPDSATYGEDGTIVIDLTTYHHAGSKQFMSTLRVSIEGDRMKQTTMSFGLNGESCDVHRAYVTRFSAKAMVAHHDRALYLTMECSADHSGMVLEKGVAQYAAKVVA